MTQSRTNEILSAQSSLLEEMKQKLNQASTKYSNATNAEVYRLAVDAIEWIKSVFNPLSEVHYFHLAQFQNLAGCTEVPTRKLDWFTSAIKTMQQVTEGQDPEKLWVSSVIHSNCASSMPEKKFDPEIIDKYEKSIAYLERIPVDLRRTREWAKKVNTEERLATYFYSHNEFKKAFILYQAAIESLSHCPTISAELLHRIRNVYTTLTSIEKIRDELQGTTTHSHANALYSFASSALFSASSYSASDGSSLSYYTSQFLKLFFIIYESDTKPMPGLSHEFLFLMRILKIISKSSIGFSNVWLKNDEFLTTLNRKIIQAEKLCCQSAPSLVSTLSKSPNLQIAMIDQLAQLNESMMQLTSKFTALEDKLNSIQAAQGKSHHKHRSTLFLPDRTGDSTSPMPK